MEVAGAAMSYEEVLHQVDSLPENDQRRLAVYLTDKLSDAELKQLGALACRTPIPSTYNSVEAEQLGLQLLRDGESST